MRVLIDECVDPRVKLLFAGHNATTVHGMGWGLKDALLGALETAKPGQVTHVGE
jgi:hypothetical protein